MTVSLKSNAAKIAINLIFRAYNDGIGLRYDIPSQASIDSFIIIDELTEFALAGDENAWWTTAYKGVYYENITQHTPVSQMNDTVSLPLTLETQSNKFLAIHEANLTNYAAMNLYASHGTTLKCDLTPWSTGEKVFAKTRLFHHGE
jgi:alpha-glucosidase